MTAHGVRRGAADRRVSRDRGRELGELAHLIEEDCQLGAALQAEVIRARPIIEAERDEAVRRDLPARAQLVSERAPEPGDDGRAASEAEVTPSAGQRIDGVRAAAECRPLQPTLATGVIGTNNLVSLRLNAESTPRKRVNSIIAAR